MNKTIIAVDFDGTLCIGNNFPEIGQPRMWLINKMIKLREEGALLILWTCREDHGGMYYENKKYLTYAVEWCKQFGLEFDAVNQNINEAKYPEVKFCRKVVADMYIDDKAVLFNDTEEAMTIIAYDLAEKSANHVNLV